jgi:DNA-binding GntR family transcriptional regulator
VRARAVAARRDPGGGWVSSPVGRPAYQRVAEDLRRQIAAGDLPVGSAIPSTAKLTKAYQVSYTVIRAAIGELRAAGLVLGQPGKGVFVRATPDEVAERTSSIDDLVAEVAELRELCGRESARREALEADVARLRRQVEALQVRVTESVKTPGPT